MKITCLGGGREVGRSAFLVEDKTRILLDYGVKLFGGREGISYPALPYDLDFAVISHPHLDHIGHLPYLYKEFSFEWYSLAPCFDIGEVLWRDSIKIAKLEGEKPPFSTMQINKAFKNWNPLLYETSTYLGNFELRLYDAGHIIGSSLILLESKNRLVYTGDFKMEETLMHKGAKPIESDILIIEGTYWDKNHPPREELINKLKEKAREVVENGGNLLLPSFALGRTQELIMAFKDFDYPVFVDGMGVEISRRYLKFPGFFKDFMEFEKAFKQMNIIDHPKKRARVLKEPSIIIATAGMLDGGPSLNYLPKLNEKSEIILTGYCAEGTNGRKLLEKGVVEIDGYEIKVKNKVHYFDLSAHAGRDEILEFIEKSNAEEVVIVHCEKAEEFEKELKERGFSAHAIKNMETLEL